MQIQGQKARLKIEKLSGINVVKFLDIKDLDYEVAEKIKTQLFGLLSNQDKNNIILDFSGVEFICCSFLANLITLNRKANNQSIKLFLCSLNQKTKEDLRYMALDKLFNISEDISSAMSVLLQDIIY